MNTSSAMALATNHQAEDLRRARQHAFASAAASSRPGPTIRRLLRLRLAPLPGAVWAPQEAVSSWRLSH
jgi:hypothetical protein